MYSLLLVSRLFLAAVFAFAGISKLFDRAGSVQALKEFGVPSRLTRPVAVILPIAELAIAVALIPSGSAAWWGAVGALGILVLFVAVIAMNLARGRRPDCHCFGQLHSTPVGWRTLLRNGILSAVAALIVWQQGNIGSDGAGWLTTLTAAEIVVLTTIVILALILAVVGWLAVNLLRQQGRLQLRIEALEQRGSHSADAFPPANNTGSQALALGLPVGSVAPEFALPRLDGELVTLGALRAQDKPVVLLFTDPGCGPCLRLLPKVGRWQHQYAGRLTLTVVSNGTQRENQAKAAEFGLSVVLLQKHHEVAQVYQYAGTPSAVVVDTDGLIAAPPVAGADAVQALVERMVSDLPLLANVPRNGQVRQAASHTHGATAHRVPRAGEPAPTFSLPDLAGKTVEIGDFRGGDALLLFWNPGCVHCQRMLPDVQEWEQTRAASAPALVLVSTGSLDANKALELESPVLLDPNGQTMASFGVAGTPTAVLIGPHGEIASEPAAGASGVFRLAADATNANSILTRAKAAPDLFTSTSVSGQRR